MPQRAVQLAATGASVMVLGPRNIPAPRPVKLGALMNGMWVVTDGLKVGEKVIVDGLQKVQPGAPVKPVPAGARPTATRPPARPGAKGGPNAR